MKTALTLVISSLLGAGLSSAAERGESNYAALRDLMIEQQITAPGRDISDPRVVEALRAVPRHTLVPEDVRGLAYADRPLPIGHGQTISQPFIVALMTEKLAPQPGDRVLEVGTGSGYQAAVLAELVDQVYTIEIVEPLADRAKADLALLGYENIHVRAGDGYQGWPEEAPFDAVIVTCAPDAVPQPLVDQLRDGGRMIIPVGTHTQELVLLEKKGDEVKIQSVLPVRFVPMTGQAQGNH